MHYSREAGRLIPVTNFMLQVHDTGLHGVVSVTEVTGRGGGGGRG